MPAVPLELWGRQFIGAVRKSSWWRPARTAFIVSLPALLLAVIGILILAAQSPYPFGSWSNFATKQAVWLVFGTSIMLAIAQANVRIWLRYAMPVFFVGLVLTGLVAVFGVVINGQRSWFSFGGLFLFQPVEILKVGLILLLARLYAVGAGVAKSTMVLSIGAVFFAAAAGSVALQPDFGSMMVLGAIWLLLTMVRGLTSKQWGALIGAGLLAVTLLWTVGLKDYQRDRIMTFIQPDTTTKASYNVRQALIAIGSGGLHGFGLGNGPQTQLRFLPVRQTDFIFAAIGEELGLIGTGGVILLFVWLLFNCIAISRRSRDNGTSYLVLGVFALLFVQIVENIGMNLGLAPVTGLSLPFVSYGGTGLVTYFLLMGFVANTAYQESYRSLRRLSSSHPLDYITTT